LKFLGENKDFLPDIKTPYSIEINQNLFGVKLIQSWDKSLKRARN
jgi:hypothetical protein